jgi:hypothetical protein
MRSERGILMLDLENGIESLTNFKRNTADYLQQLHQTGTPLVLTVIREGLADSAAGRVKPARKALQALAKKYGITGGDDAL